MILYVCIYCIILCPDKMFQLCETLHVVTFSGAVLIGKAPLSVRHCFRSWGFVCEGLQVGADACLRSQPDPIKFPVVPTIWKCHEMPIHGLGTNVIRKTPHFAIFTVIHQAN